MADGKRPLKLRTCRRMRCLMRKQNRWRGATPGGSMFVLQMAQSGQYGPSLIEKGACTWHRLFKQRGTVAVQLRWATEDRGRRW